MIGDIERGKYFLLVIELLLLVILIHVLHIEEILGFLRITPIIFVGFAVHAVIPRRFRLPFFLFLSVLAIGVSLGIGHASLLIAIGLGLVGICHLPFALFVRTALLVIASLILAAFRAKWIEASWADRVLPILGAMFMFRLIIYLYDLRHEKQSAPLSQRLAYFFMLPNSCFPLFPVVDYQTFKRTYYDGEPSEIYQKGATWMFRGLTHLVLFRVVYHYAVPGSADIIDLPAVFIYVVSAYLLYLHISGQFHLIVGILCLFGFNLPQTHHLYFFASGFNDFWRRVNIYWKDFLVKIIYYPVYMKLRKLGTTPAMIVATLVVFLATWLLHSYQWFWFSLSERSTLCSGAFWACWSSPTRSMKFGMVGAAV